MYNYTSSFSIYNINFMLKLNKQITNKTNKMKIYYTFNDRSHIISKKQISKFCTLVMVLNNRILNLNIYFNTFCITNLALNYAVCLLQVHLQLHLSLEQHLIYQLNWPLM